MRDIADRRERLMILRVRNIGVDVNLRGNTGFAPWDVRNQVAAIGTIETILMFELGDQLAFCILHRNRAALLVTYWLAFSFQVWHLYESFINRLNGRGPGDAPGRGQALRDDRDHRGGGASSAA